MANVVAGLGAQLGLDTTEFRKGIAEAKESVESLKETIETILEVTAIYEMVKSVMEMSNAIVETARANEVAVASVLELSKALEENGGRAEDVGKIYSGFNAKIEAAAQGNAKAQESFGRLGVTLNDLAHLSTEDLFDKTISGLSRMKDAAERNGLAMQTLGKGIRGVDIMGLAHDLEEGKGAMDKFANSVTMAHELTEKLEKRQHELALNITDSIIPALNTLYDSYARTGTVVKLLHDFMEDLAVGAVIVVKTITTGFSQLFDIVKAIGKWAIDFTNLDFKKAGQDLFAGFDEIKKDGKEYLDFFTELKKALSKEPEKPKPKSDIERPIIDANKKIKDSIDDIARSYMNQEEVGLRILQNKLTDKALTANEKEQADALLKVDLDRKKAIDELEKKRAAIDMKATGAQAAIAEINAAVRAVEAFYETMSVKTLDAVEKNQKAQTEFGYGWQKAFDQYKEGAQTMASVGTRAFDSVASALEKFVTTGKLNFKSLAQSIISDILQIQIKAQIAKMVSGFSFSGLMNGPYNAGAGDYGASSLAAAFGGPKANGGPVDGGTPYLVGENGPELVVPRNSGTVIPNSKLGGMGGTNTTNVTNNYIQAIDTQSFEQRLYGSSQAIWAANQYATKNLATNRART